jgi:hypothetical protein
MPKIFVRYVFPDGREETREYSEHFPVAGQFVFEGPKAYRVDEVWDIWERHGGVTHGLTAFLTEVDVMEHRLGQHVSGYYGN